MAKSIPLTVSSSLTNLTTAETLAVGTHENNGTTGAQAPILLDLQATRTEDADGFAAQMPAKGGQGTTAQARLVVNAVAAALNDLVDEYGAVTVNTPIGTVETFVAGSVENASDAVDPAVNVPFLGVQPPETYRKQIANIGTYVPTSACPATLKRVRDKATGAQQIEGTDAFYLEGTGMTYGSTGEKVELLNALTLAKVCDVTVDADKKSTVQLICNLAPTATVAKGTYILRLTTLAGSGETGGTLWPLDLKVTLASDAVKE